MRERLQVGIDTRSTHRILDSFLALLNSVLNVKALVGAFNQEKALVGAFSVSVQPVVEPMDRFAALPGTCEQWSRPSLAPADRMWVPLSWPVLGRLQFHNAVIAGNPKTPSKLHEISSQQEREMSCKQGCHEYSNYSNYSNNKL